MHVQVGKLRSIAAVPVLVFVFVFVFENSMRDLKPSTTKRKLKSAALRSNDVGVGYYVGAHRYLRPAVKETLVNGRWGKLDSSSSFAQIVPPRPFFSFCFGNVIISSYQTQSSSNTTKARHDNSVVMEISHSYHQRRQQHQPSPPGAHPCPSCSASTD